MKSKIKTVCGLEKYEELSQRKGIFNRVRFYWFVLFASIRDFCKKRSINEEKSGKHSKISIVPKFFSNPFNN